MSELINNSNDRKRQLKELILKLHVGESPQVVKQQLVAKLSSIPYGEVVEVEQELIAEGLPMEDVLRLCDVHSEVLEGSIDLSAQKAIPAGHPVEVIHKENEALYAVYQQITNILEVVKSTTSESFPSLVLQLRALYNQLFDVDKLYQRKEYLLFPYLEKEGITGPPKVMWGKHDEIRELIKGSIDILQTPHLTPDDLLAAADIILFPAAQQVVDMGRKERAPFWINMHEKMVYIEYFALRNEQGEYLGTLEVSNDITPYRKLEGEQRILAYSK